MLRILLIIVLLVAAIRLVPAVASNPRVKGAWTRRSWSVKATPTPRPTSTPTPTPTPTVMVTPGPSATGSAQKTGKMWGTFAGDGTKLFLDLETKVGVKASMTGVFVHWGNENQFPKEWKTIASTRKNFTLVIYWEAMDYNKGIDDQNRFSYDQILAGNWNSYIDSFAAEAKAYGYPVVIIPFEEMNGDWYQWSGSRANNTPGKHKAAYRYIRERFRTVTNVKFAWVPNNDSVPDTAENSILTYYPGDDVVDIVGVDGFNFDGPWQTWSSVFSKALSQLYTLNKGVMIFSTASAPGTKKAAWIEEMITAVKSDPRLLGFIWFNENKEKDWRIWSSTDSLASFTKNIVGL